MSWHLIGSIKTSLWQQQCREVNCLTILYILQSMLPVRLLRVPWTARRSSQSIQKVISPGISLEGMMLKLKLQYFGPLMGRVDSLEKTLMLGGIGAGGEGEDRGWDGWMASLTRWTWVWVNSGGWWWTGRPGVLRFMGWGHKELDTTERLIWSDLIWCSTVGPCCLYILYIIVCIC